MFIKSSVYINLSVFRYINLLKVFVLFFAHVIFSIGMAVYYYLYYIHYVSIAWSLINPMVK